MLALDADGVCTHGALALTGVGGVPVSGDEAARRLVGDRPSSAAFEAVARDLAGSLEPDSDLHASAEYRRWVAEALTRRALARALERARTESA